MNKLQCKLLQLYQIHFKISQTIIINYHIFILVNRIIDCYSYYTYWKHMLMINLQLVPAIYELELGWINFTFKT